MESDIRLLSATNDVFTYCNDNGVNTSWIDHVLYMNNKVTDISIIYDCISSDYRPVSFVLNCHCQPTVTSISNAYVDTNKFIFHDWSNIDTVVANLYSIVLADRLDRISVPLSLRSCCHTRCNNPLHSANIDQYYNDVIQCLKHSVD